METKRRSFIYGPVPSRRLGRSLGVDLVPYKVCTYDCIYCQLGRTTTLTADRKEWVTTNEVVAQLRDALHSKPDYITLSGSGEPTLHAQIGQLIRQIKGMTSIPVAAITNGSLLWQREVRESLLEADLVVPSLAADGEETFRYVNRPHRSIRFEQMLEGLRQFRESYRGQYWLEVLFLSGVTTVEARVRRLAECIRSIAPDRVQLNTVVRPPAEDYAMPVPPARLEEIAAQLYPTTELILPRSQMEGPTGKTVHDADVLDLLRRRPCSVADIAGGLQLHPHEVAKCVGRLLSEHMVRARAQEGRLYYEIIL